MSTIKFKIAFQRHLTVSNEDDFSRPNADMSLVVVERIDYGKTDIAVCDER